MCGGGAECKNGIWEVLELRSVEDCDWNVGKCEVGVWKCKGCGECADLGVRESSAMQNVGA